MSRVLYYWHSLGNGVLTTLSNMVTNLNLSDMETCYKLVRTDLMKTLPLTSDRFGFEPELTARLAQSRARIYEVPISYSGRTYAEGKRSGGLTVSPRSGISSGSIFSRRKRRFTVPRRQPSVVQPLLPQHRYDLRSPHTPPLLVEVIASVEEIASGVGKVLRPPTIGICIPFSRRKRSEPIASMLIRYDRSIYDGNRK